MGSSGRALLLVLQGGGGRAFLLLLLVGSGSALLLALLGGGGRALLPEGAPLLEGNREEGPERGPLARGKGCP